MQKPYRTICTLALFAAVWTMTLALPAAAQNRIIKGKVTNDAGQPVQGADILIQGTDV